MPISIKKEIEQWREIGKTLLEMDRKAQDWPGQGLSDTDGGCFYEARQQSPELKALLERINQLLKDKK